jgi:hypothetical protein
MEADSVLMDANIYDVQFGIVGKPLLKKQVFLNLRGRGIISYSGDHAVAAKLK